ncbi:MAG: response regulator [Bacteroidetes bacterium]|nr:response regulator [Bacteroidota bacterium]
MRGLDILIVDDSKLIGERLIRLLHGLPAARSVHLEDGLVSAAAYLENIAPDLLILDHHFPEGYGSELLERSKNRLEGTHIILYSAFGSLLNDSEYRNHGVHVVLDKSEAPEALISLVESIARIRNGNDIEQPSGAVGVEKL